MSIDETEPDAERPRSGLWGAMVVLFVYVLLGPLFAVLIYGLYNGFFENAAYFDLDALIGFYRYGWYFPLLAGLPHALARNWEPAMIFLIAVVPVGIITGMFHWALGASCALAATLCFILAHRLHWRV